MVAVAIIDVSQGLELDCVLFDMDVFTSRTTSIEFVRASEQINVAITRANYLHISVCDLSTLNDTKFHR